MGLLEQINLLNLSDDFKVTILGNNYVIFEEQLEPWVVVYLKYMIYMVKLFYIE